MYPSVFHTHCSVSYSRKSSEWFVGKYTVYKLTWKMLCPIQSLVLGVRKLLLQEFLCKVEITFDFRFTSVAQHFESWNCNSQGKHTPKHQFTVLTNNSFNTTVLENIVIMLESWEVWLEAVVLPPKKVLYILCKDLDTIRAAGSALNVGLVKNLAVLNTPF